MLLEELKRGKRVKETKGRREGRIIWCEDLHNVQVEWEDYTYTFYCFKEDCCHYNGNEIKLLVETKKK